MPREAGIWGDLADAERMLTLKGDPHQNDWSNYTHRHGEVLGYDERHNRAFYAEIESLRELGDRDGAINILYAEADVAKGIIERMVNAVVLQDNGKLTTTKAIVTQRVNFDPEMPLYVKFEVGPGSKVSKVEVVHADEGENDLPMLQVGLDEAYVRRARQQVGLTQSGAPGSYYMTALDLARDTLQRIYHRGRLWKIQPSGSIGVLDSLKLPDNLQFTAGRSRRPQLA